MSRVKTHLMWVVLLGLLFTTILLWYENKTLTARYMLEQNTTSALRQYMKISEELYTTKLTAALDVLTQWEKKNTEKISGHGHRWPFDEQSYITSPYGRRKDPFRESGYTETLLYGGRMYGQHTGVDISTRCYKAEIKSPVNGTVVTHYVPPQQGTRWKGHKLYGGMIEILDDEGRTWLFAHLSTTYVHEGYKVKEGDVIARMGSTGRVTKGHLHLEVKDENGWRQNPLDLLDYELINPSGIVIIHEGENT